MRLLAHVATQADAGRPPSDRLAVLLHGWEGSANSLYLLSLGQNLFDAGYDVVRLNLRDHGDSHHLNSGLFHSCRIAEVVGAVRELQRQHPRIVAVCPVIDPEHTLARLESGWALYREYFVWKWRRSLRRKREAWPDVYHSLDDILELGNLTEMTHRLACGYGGFPSLPEYLRGYALVDRALEPLAALRDTRVRIIAADDDPIIPAHALRWALRIL